MAHLPLWVAALWWGSLTTIGFLVVPMLFVHLPTLQLAGGMAARLFSSQTWLSCVCALLLLINLRPKPVSRSVPEAHDITFFVVAGVLFAVFAEFAIAPKIVARENLRLWHSVASVMYALQWLCAAIAFWKLSGSSQRLTRPDSF